MADEVRRDGSVDGGGTFEEDADPQRATPLPGDPREAQEPQEPRSTHVGGPDRDTTTEGGVVEQLKQAWDRMRGKR